MVCFGTRRRSSSLCISFLFRLCLNAIKLINLQMNSVMSLSCQCGGNFVILIKSNSKPGPQKPTKQIKIMYCIKSCLKKKKSLIQDQFILCPSVWIYWAEWDCTDVLNTNRERSGSRCKWKITWLHWLAWKGQVYSSLSVKWINGLFFFQCVVLVHVINLL